MTLALAPVGPGPDVTIDLDARPAADRSAGPVGRRRSATMEVVGERPGRAVPGPDASAALVRAGTGDQAAFAEFYDAVASVVHGLVLRVLRDPAMAEEVTQEVFLELWRLAPRYDPGRGSARSWAATVAHRRAVDRVRAEQSARDREHHPRQAPPRDHDVVDEEVTARLDRAGVRRALAELSDVQREALTLAYLEGHTYREVARLLDTPEGTVKTRIRDGLLRLRERLGDTP